MSNPAVFLLNKSKIRENIIMIEDNIGEAIHFHIGLARFDLTIEEFDDIALKLINVVNEQLNVREFDLTRQNEYFLQRIAPIIPYITKVEEIEVDIEELKYRFETQEGNIQEDYIANTPVYQYYIGNKSIIDDYVFERDIWQSKEELMEQVKKERNHEIFIDENKFVLDGYKSLCVGMAMSDIQKVIKVKKISIAKGQDICCSLLREVKWW